MSILKHLLRINSISNRGNLLSTSIANNIKSMNREINKLQLKRRDGSIVRLGIQYLSIDLMDLFLDLKMNYFVKEEIGHRIAGISEYPEAVKEYREILTNMFKHPSYITRIYTIDDEFNSKTKIVAASMMKLIKSNEDSDDNIHANTKALRRYIDILSTYNKLFSIEDIMSMYNVDCYYEDLGMIVHPEYRTLGICHFEEEARRLMCKIHKIRLTGAWCTTRASQKICEERNWDTAFEISYKKLGSLLGVNIKDAPAMCKYMAIKITVYMGMSTHEFTLAYGFSQLVHPTTRLPNIEDHTSYLLDLLLITLPDRYSITVEAQFGLLCNIAFVIYSTMLALRCLTQFIIKTNKRLQNAYVSNLISTPNQTYEKVDLKNNKDGSIIKLRIQDLSEDIFEELLDFTMNYFIKEETTHKIAGISKDPEAVKEFRKIVSEIYMNPSCIKRIYVTDDEVDSNRKIVASSVVKLITSNEDINDIFHPRTYAVRRYRDILSIYNKLFSVEDIMKKYNVDRYYEDMGMAVHPDYRTLGMFYYEIETRFWMCKKNKIPLTGAWCTTYMAQKVCAKKNWHTSFEISRKELESHLGVNIQSSLPTWKYMAIKIE
ncbi:uncharacterized protein LOC113513768 [Galleria mellonella]|uniref:Uncharacterized protein LOC113513768 n=1 Tax=Galleria mellonella TaxID=7137 RepID=A0ABM3N718_GALME|nr:uncharacterized protein LOC113513768 [Galleria mellonella]